MKKIDIKNNYESSITRCVRKDNTIRYLSNRYSVPLGTFGRHETVGIKESDQNQLIIYIPETGEIIATHSISNEKGVLIKDRQHSRDRTKGIDAFMDTVALMFEDDELAYGFLCSLRKKYPRYIRDQLQMILKEIKANDSQILSLALGECIKRNLHSATDFSDIVSYIKRHRQIHDIVATNTKSVTLMGHVTDWVMKTEAQKREVDAYTSILAGDNK